MPKSYAAERAIPAGGRFLSITGVLLLVRCGDRISRQGARACVGAAFTSVAKQRERVHGLCLHMTPSTCVRSRRTRTTSANTRRLEPGIRRFPLDAYPTTSQQASGNFVLVYKYIQKLEKKNFFFFFCSLPVPPLLCQRLLLFPSSRVVYAPPCLCSSSPQSVLLPLPHVPMFASTVTPLPRPTQLTQPLSSPPRSSSATHPPGLHTMFMVDL